MTKQEQAAFIAKLKTITIVPKGGGKPVALSEVQCPACHEALKDHHFEVHHMRMRKLPPPKPTEEDSFAA